jgi:hypothetical protein
LFSMDGPKFTLDRVMSNIRREEVSLNLGGLIEEGGTSAIHRGMWNS